METANVTSNVAECMLTYKGYVGTEELDTDHYMYHGRVVNTRDVITYVAETPARLWGEFVTSIEAYLESCREDGVEPNKPAQWTINSL